MNQPIPIKNNTPEPPKAKANLAGTIFAYILVCAVIVGVFVPLSIALYRWAFSV